MSHGTDLSHQNPWNTHGNVLSHYSLGDLSCLVCRDILLYPTSLGTILSQVTKEYASVTSDHQSTSLLITNSGKIIPMNNIPHTISWDQIKSKYAPVISHYQSKSLPIIMSLAAMSNTLHWWDNFKSSFEEYVSVILPHQSKPLSITKLLASLTIYVATQQSCIKNTVIPCSPTSRVLLNCIP